MGEFTDRTSADNIEVRDALLTRIRRTQSHDKLDAKRRQAVMKRLNTHPANLIPARGEGDRGHVIDLFCQMMETASTTVHEVTSPKDIPGAVADFLREHNLPQRIRFGKDAALSSLSWSKVPSLEISQGKARVADEASLSRAFGAVAESGTLVMISGQDNPTTLNFLPENHIVVIEADRIAGNYEEVWGEIRKFFGEGTLPRTVNMISGPSRTGDIEQKIELGAHGPRRLHVIVLHKPGAKPKS